MLSPMVRQEENRPHGRDVDAEDASACTNQLVRDQRSKRKGDISGPFHFFHIFELKINRGDLIEPTLI